MAMRVHMEITGSSASAVQAARETRTALVEVSGAAEKLGAQARGAASNVVPLTTATGGLSKSFRDLAAGGIQNVSYQIADFASQVAAGGSPVVALAQQLPQLAAGFGVAGAAIGAVLAVGIPVAAALLGAGNEAKTLTERSGELADASDRLSAALKAVDVTNRQLADTYNQNARAMRGVLEMQAGLAQAEFGERMRAQVVAITESFGALDSMISTPSRDALGVSPTELVLRNIAGALDAAAPAAQEVLDHINALSGATGAEEQAQASLDLARAMAQAAGGAGNLTGESLELYRALLDTAQAGFGATAALEAAGTSAGGAAGQFRGAAAAARDAALAFAEYQNSRLLAERQSKARLDQRTAPLASTEDSRNVHDRGVLLTYEDRQALARTEVAAGRAATRGSGGRAGGGGRSLANTAAREAERGQKAVERLIESLRAEQDALNTSDPLQQEMIKLRERMTYATVEQRVTIEDLLRTQMAEEAALDAQVERMDTIRDVGVDAFGKLRDGIMEGARAGDILGGVLSGIGDRLIDLGSSGLMDVLFGKQGEAGGGVLSSVLGSILPFAAGGVVTSPTLFGFGGGRVGLMGEAGPEAIMPLAAGMVGARVGGRETRLPITRLASGDLGVSVTPFARGGVVTPGPLAWAASGPAGGQGGGAAGAQGRMRIELALSQDLEARLLEEAGAQADVKITRGLKQFDRALPGKVDRIRKDSSYRGSR